MTESGGLATFGTDGIRGRFGTELTLPLAHQLGIAAATHLIDPHPQSAAAEANLFVVGRDTRHSSPDLARALTDGVAHAAPTAQIVDLGVATTPMVSFACGQLRCAGAAVTASHNPYVDNGVKLFSVGGRKLTEDAQAQLAEQLASATPERAGAPATSPAALTAASPAAPSAGSPAGAPSDLLAAYQASLVEDVADVELDGLSIVVDCANGAASPYAQELLGALGADVTVLFAEPDGRNINDACGSAAPAALQAAVTAAGAQLGLALDGDGDRVIACDEGGTLVNGDRLMALFAIDLASRDELANTTLVTTVMSNGALDVYLATRGINVVRTDVGDRHVLDALDAGGFNLGGEQSGHIIFYDRCATGDGLRAGIRLMALMRRYRQPLSSLAASVLEEFPQVLTNVPVGAVLEHLPDDVRSEVNAMVAASPARVLVRPSGTEPLVRVMVESPDETVTQQLAQRLRALLVARLT